MTYIDFYTMKRNGKPQDFEKAHELCDGDIDAEYFVDTVKQRMLHGAVSEDGDEIAEIDGEEVFILQYHNGVGDGGDTDICNAEWIHRDFPEVFELLGVQIAWGNGTSALTGNPVNIFG